VQDLSEEIINQIRDKIPNLNFKVYRGQRINAQDFQRLKSNRGGLISMNTFMSTTKNIKLASIYAGNGEERPACESCLFEIEVNPLMDINRILFADISGRTNFPEEAEILFSMGMIFRIQSVEEKNGIWCIKLISDVIKASPAKEVCERLLNESNNISQSLLVFYMLLSITYPLNKMERYFKLLEREYSNDDETICIIYDVLSKLYLKKGDHQKAIKYLKKQRLLLEKNGPLGHAASGRLFLGEGYLFMKFGLFDQAEFSFQLALNRIALSGDTLPSFYLPLAYKNIGEAYFHKNNMDNALFYFKKALDLCLSDNRNFCLNLTICYTWIGRVYWNKEDYSTALQYFKKVNEINEQILPSNCHKNTVILYSIANLYVETGDYTMAFEYYNKYNNAEHCDPHCIKDLSCALFYTAVAIRHYRQSEWIIAMKFLQEAVNIQKIFSPFHPTLGLTYCLMGNIYRNFIKDYTMASLYHEKSDNIFNKQHTKNFDVGILNPIQGNVAQDYHDLGDNMRLGEFVKEIVGNKMGSLQKLYKMAKTSDNQLIFLDTTGDTLTVNTHALCDNGSEKINQTNESLNTTSFIASKTLYFSYFQLGEKYAIEQDFENALINFEKGIEEQQKFLSYEHPSFIPSYNAIASVLYQLKDYKKMLHYLEKVLHIHQSRRPVNHRKIFETYHNMLEAYISLKDELVALKCSEVLLDLSLKYDYPETKTIQQLQDALVSKHPKGINESEISAYPSYNEEKFNCYSFEDIALLRNNRMWHEYRSKSREGIGDDVCYVFQGENDPFWWIKITGRIPNATPSDVRDLLDTHFVERQSEWQKTFIFGEILHRYNSNAEICYFQYYSPLPDGPPRDTCFLKYVSNFCSDDSFRITYRSIDVPLRDGFIRTKYKGARAVGTLEDGVLYYMSLHHLEGVGWMPPIQLNQLQCDILLDEVENIRKITSKQPIPINDNHRTS
jgi:tetratricopeptide (TPR) repeat protein